MQHRARRRLPIDRWICVDMQTPPEPNGNYSSALVLADRKGPFGRAPQTLLFREGET